MDCNRFIEYFNTRDGCSKQVGVRVLRIGDGEAEAELQVREENKNFMGALHGGALATLVDVAAGCCTYHHQRFCVTLDTSIQYLRGIRAGTAHAHAHEVHGGGHIAVCRVDVTDDGGALCCTATVTMYLKEAAFNIPI